MLGIFYIAHKDSIEAMRTQFPRNLPRRLPYKR